MLTQLSRSRSGEAAGIESYQQWCEQAIRYDQRRGLERWKQNDRTRLYDFQAVRNRVDLYRQLRKQRDDQGLLFALNEGIHGNMGGMGSAELYNRAKFGTKVLITDYIDEITSALTHLASPAVDNISLEEKYEFFHRASHCFGRSALMLSGSGSLFYFHLGVVKALWEENILPSVISGASGGAIVAAVVGSHTSEDLKKIFDPHMLKMEVGKEVGLINKLSLLGRSHVSPNDVEEFFARLIPDITFQEAWELTGIHINVSVAAAELHQTSRLLNDIASPNVMLREALLASSAFPGFYPAVTLAARDKNGSRKPYLPHRKWIDGSVSDDLPIKRVSRLYGVNHTLVSQTNPLALPFITESQSPGMRQVFKNAVKKTTKEWALASAKLIDRPMKRSPALSRLIKLTSSVLSQTYTGDINILPPRKLFNPLSLLSQRNTDEIIELIRDGERATWPHIEKIRIQTKISRTLDAIIKEMEASLVHNSSNQGFSRRRNRSVRNNG